MKITHDIHTHTLFSTCCVDPAATMAAYVKKARELGHTVFGISNHMWDERVPGASSFYRGQSIEYGFEAKYALPADTGGVRVLFGVETEYCGMSDTLAMTLDSAKRFDYVLVPHSHTHMWDFVIPYTPDVQRAREVVARRLAAAFPEMTAEQAAQVARRFHRSELAPFITEPTVENEAYVADFLFTSFESLLAHPVFTEMAACVPTLIAHPFCPCDETHDFFLRTMAHVLEKKERLYEDFRRAAKLGVDLDVNIEAYKVPENGYTDDPMVAVMRIARAAGCKFAFGSDSHTLAGLEKIRLGEAIGAAIGITEADLSDLVK